MEKPKWTSLSTQRRRKWQPTPVFLPGESHRQRSPVGYSWWGRKELDATEWLTHTHTRPTQYVFALSCLSVFFRPAAIKQTPPPISSPTISNLAIPKVLIMIGFEPHAAQSLVFTHYWPESWKWGDMNNFLTVSTMFVVHTPKLRLFGESFGIFGEVFLDFETCSKFLSISQCSSE